MYVLKKAKFSSHKMPIRTDEKQMTKIISSLHSLH